MSDKSESNPAPKDALAIPDMADQPLDDVWGRPTKATIGSIRNNVPAARDWAAEALGRCVKWFDRVSGHEWRANDLSKSARDERGLNHECIKTLIAAADEDPDAHQAVCGIVAGFLASDRPLPRNLKWFAVHYLSDLKLKPEVRSKRGWDPVARYGRDICIIDTVDKLVNYGGLSRTRNVATDKPSACSIVAEVLNELGETISEKTVAEITKQLRR